MIGTICQREPRNGPAAARRKVHAGQLFGNPVKGYRSLRVAPLFLAGVQLMALAVIGEYLERVYDDSKGRPVYLVRHTLDANGGNTKPQ